MSSFCLSFLLILLWSSLFVLLTYSYFFYYYNNNNNDNNNSNNANNYYSDDCNIISVTTIFIIIIIIIIMITRIIIIIIIIIILVIIIIIIIIVTFIICNCWCYYYCHYCYHWERCSKIETDYNFTIMWYFSSLFIYSILFHVIFVLLLTLPNTCLFIGFYFILFYFLLFTASISIFLYLEVGWEDQKLSRPIAGRSDSEITKYAAELIKNGVYY